MGKFLSYLKILALGVIVYFVAKYDKKVEREYLKKETEKRRDVEHSLASMKEVREVEAKINENVRKSITKSDVAEKIDFTNINPDLKFGSAKDRLSK